MPSEISAAIIGAGAALLGGGLGAFATYRAALVGFNARRREAQLRARLEDLEFFIALEVACIDRLAAAEGKAKPALKQELRGLVRDKMDRELHRDAEPARVRAALQRLA